ncbi:hypothetical protein AC249_AIPGENE16669 [Exaiptasia diaphana]|nr:hypothetical protein AC249_AIPGENE16669 [Exaiptasia diaphana]
MHLEISEDSASDSFGDEDFGHYDDCMLQSCKDSFHTDKVKPSKKNGSEKLQSNTTDMEEGSHKDQERSEKLQSNTTDKEEGSHKDQITFAPRNYHACFYCNDSKVQTQITRHIERAHKNEEMWLENQQKRSKKSHHLTISPVFIAMASSKMWRHCNVCKENKSTKKYERLQSHSNMLLPSYSQADCGRQLTEYVLSRMKDDDVSLLARKDPLIMKFGTCVLDKVGTSKSYYVSQRIRQLARLLKALKEKDESLVLEDYIDPTRYDKIVTTTRDICQFDIFTRKVSLPSLALHLGHSVKKCAIIVKRDALKSNNSPTVTKAKNFLE